MTAKKKRQYSRNGCKECKRRKLKCDEGQPECWQCSHLGKPCVYVKRIKFSASRNVTVEQASLPTPQYGVLNFGGDISEPLENDIPMEFDSSAAPDSSPYFSQISPGEARTRMINEASTLANTIIETLDPHLDAFVMDFAVPDDLKKKNVLDSFNLAEPHKQHLEIFYDKISAWIMPLEQNLCNQILLYNAKSAPYLLAAMLSLTTKDEEKMKYISTCLKNLSDVFQDQSKVLDNIESLILTVLLLAADSSSNNWRTHLRGAKDLFTKYIKFYTTPSLLLAKSWFAAIEILAGLQRVGTGKAHELDNLLDVGLYGDNSDFGVGVGLLLPNGYNLFLGYSTEAIIMYREFIKLTNANSKDILFQISLIHSAKEFQVASDKILIEAHNPAHPNYQGGENRMTLPWSCYAFKGDSVYSWFDLIHHLHVDALLLNVYNGLLEMPPQHRLCQDLLKSMLSMCFFFEGTKILEPSDNRLLMVQGPVLMCGLNCIEDDDKAHVEAYFQCLIDGGVRSATASLKKIHNAWTGANDGEVEYVPFA